MDYLNDLESVWGMDDTPEKIKVLERIIAGADLYNNIDDGIEARDLLIDTCLTAGFPKKQLQAFSWLIKKWEDKDSDAYIDTEDLFGNINGLVNMSRLLMKYRKRKLTAF